MRATWMFSLVLSCLAASGCSSSPQTAPAFEVTDDDHKDEYRNSDGEENDPDLAPSGGQEITPVDCSVTFEKHVLPRIQNVWRCGASMCHGNPGANSPAMDTNDADTTYKALTTTMHNGLPVVNVNSDKPEDSALSCLLAGTCGQRMPYQGVSDSDLAVARAWLSCGAPR